MTQQGEQFVRRVLKADPTPVTFSEVVTYFRHRGGSGRAGAKLAGVSESTFRRWSAGTTPKAGTIQRVTEAFRGLRSAPSRMGDAGVMIPVWSADRKRGGRERDVSGVQLQLMPGTLAAAHEVWVKTGDGDKAFRRFVEGIGNAWYRAQLGAAAQRGTPAAGGSNSGGGSGSGSSRGGGQGGAGTGAAGAAGAAGGRPGGGHAGGSAGGGGGGAGSGGGGSAGGGDDDEDDFFDDGDEYEDLDFVDEFVNDDYGMSIA